MTKGDRTLVLLLYFLGASGVMAIVAVCMPMAWMAAGHRALGLGDMPAGPIVEYLARSVSAFYALFGGLCLVLAADLERYRALVRIMGLFVIALGVAFIGIDLAAKMPWWWSALEGPTTVGGGIVMFLLARATGEKRQSVA